MFVFVPHAMHAHFALPCPPCLPISCPHSLVLYGQAHSLLTWFFNSPAAGHRACLHTCASLCLLCMWDMALLPPFPSCWPHALQHLAVLYTRTAMTVLYLTQKKTWRPMLPPPIQSVANWFKRTPSYRSRRCDTPGPRRSTGSHRQTDHGVPFGLLVCAGHMGIILLDVSSCGLLGGLPLGC